MDVANLELCKELYELSGWDDSEELGAIKSSETTGEVAILPPGKNFYYGDRTPAYTLGYLMRKLPNKLDNGGQLILFAGDSWSAGYEYPEPYASSYYEHVEEADTPEDAACLLAIEFFKQGILKKDAA